MAFTLNDIFSPTGPAPVHTTPATVANPAAPTTVQPTQSSDGKPPFEQSNTPNPVPLDKFNDLFTIAPVDPNNPQQDPDAPYFKLPTDEELHAQVTSMSFLDAAKHQELVTKAAGGDVQAFAEVVNIAARNAYAQGAKLSARVSEDATRNGVSRVRSSLPNDIRSNLARTEVQELNPAFQHPALAPMVQAARATIEQKFPGANSSEIARMTNEYIQMALNHAKTPTPIQQDNKRGGSQEIQDFSTFFGNRG